MPSRPSSWSSSRSSGLPLPAAHTANSSVTLTYISTFFDRCKSHLQTDIDAEMAFPHLFAYEVHMGFVNAITFNALSIWAGFQSADTVQLGIALARLIEDPGQGVHMLDRQAAASLGAFVLGALLARPAASCARQRGWLLFATLLQALLLGGATLAIVRSSNAEEPSSSRLTTGVNWTDTNGFMGLICVAASVGLQGATAQRLKTPFGTTATVTSTWVDLAIEPTLFQLRVAYTKATRASAVLGTFIGGFAGRAIMQALGTRWTLGIAALTKVGMAVSWLVMRGNSTSREDK